MHSDCRKSQKFVFLYGFPKTNPFGRAPGTESPHYCSRSFLQADTLKALLLQFPYLSGICKHFALFFNNHIKRVDFSKKMLYNILSKGILCFSDKPGKK